MKTRTYAVAAAALFVGCAFGQESGTETQAIRCAGLSFVLTSVSDASPEFGRAMSASVEFYRAAFGASQQVRTKSTMTNGEIRARQELVMAELKKSWSSNPDSVISEAALCNSWRAAIARRLAAAQEPRSAAEFLQLVGSPPSAPSAEEVAKWRQIVPAAFAAWAESDFATPGSVRRQVEESLRQR